MPAAAPHLSAFVLAGGKSTRMGTDKALVVLQGRKLVERALEVARSVTSCVSIVGDASKFASFGPVVEDIFPGCGPLGGIHAALRRSKNDLNLILAVDLPFVSAELLHYLVRRAGESPTALVTVPRTSQGWQPLCAVYRRKFQDLAEPSLRAGRYRIDALFDQKRTQVITGEELLAAGLSADRFTNVNTPGDLAAARENSSPSDTQERKSIVYPPILK
jgi:molybdenum cofactor guanylyltransferase